MSSCVSYMKAPGDHLALYSLSFIPRQGPKHAHRADITLNFLAINCFPGISGDRRRTLGWWGLCGAANAHSCVLDMCHYLRPAVMKGIYFGAWYCTPFLVFVPAFTPDESRRVLQNLTRVTMSSETRRLYLKNILTFGKRHHSLV